MAIWEPLISFCGGVFVVQLALCRAHMLLKSVKSSKSFVFSPDGSYCKRLSGSLGQVCVHYSSYSCYIIVCYGARMEEQDHRKSSNSTVVQSSEENATCLSKPEKTSSERQKTLKESLLVPYCE